MRMAVSGYGLGVEVLMRVTWSIRTGTSKESWLSAASLGSFKKETTRATPNQSRRSPVNGAEDAEVDCTP
jgi:hypothetical protein